MRRTSRPRSGFTLVELVCTIVIVGILASVSLPRLFNFSSKAQQAVHNNIAGVFSRSMQMLHAQWILDRHRARPATRGNGAFLTLQENAQTLEVGYWQGSGYPECIGECNFDGKLNASECMNLAEALLEGTLPFGQDYVATTVPTNGGDCIYTRKDSPINKIRYSAVSGMVKSCDDPASCQSLTGSTLMGDY